VSLGRAHQPLRDQVRDHLRDRIVTGKLQPGDRMVERELAAEYGVSRIPVREAIRILESEGFVSVVPRRGVVVRRMEKRDIEELFDVREALEVLAVRRATERATKAELRQLEKTLTAARKALLSDNLEAIGAANDSFHDGIIGLAHNGLLATMLEPLSGRLHWLFRQSDDPAALYAEHQQLFEAISSGDPDRAAAEALRHVQTNRDRALHLLFGQPSAEVVPAPADADPT
jgi:DNA-binding GntR family transcriptional regulator